MTERWPDEDLNDYDDPMTVRDDGTGPGELPPET